MTSEEQKYRPEDFFHHKGFRKGQKEIIRKIHESARNQTHFILSAPNGTGKSIIALSAVLPTIFDKNLKLIYLCKTHRQNYRIFDEVKKIVRKNKINLSCVSFKGKKESCLQKISSKKYSNEDVYELCKKLRKKKSCAYYQKIKEAKETEFRDWKTLSVNPESYDEYFSLLNSYKNKVVKAEKILKTCKEKKYCPYYFLKDLLKSSNVIIGNYLYIFNKKLRADFLRAIKTPLENCIIVIDECHNLPETVLDINSKTLSYASINKILNHPIDPDKNKVFQDNPNRNEIISKLINVLRFLKEDLKNQIDLFKKELNNKKDTYNPDYKRYSNSFVEKLSRSLGFDSPESFVNFLNSGVVKGLSNYFTKKGENDVYYIDPFTKFVKFLNKLYNYLPKKSYFAGIKKKKKSDNVFKSSYKILPLDSRDFIFPVLKECFTSLHLSGTVHFDLYESLTGLSGISNLRKEQLNSPFKRKILPIIIDYGISSRFRQRNLINYKRTNQIMKIIIQNTKTEGNIGIFSNSYSYMRFLNSRNLEKNNRLINIVKKSERKTFWITEYNKKDHSRLIELFKKSRNSVLLDTLGGKSFEGEDFPGKQLETVIICGLQLAPPNNFVKEKIRYYDHLFNGKGEDYAYNEPAVRKANQAAGRIIRDENDRGVIIFLDYRYNSWKYKKFISNWIKKEGLQTIDNIDNLRNILIGFWKNRN